MWPLRRINTAHPSPRSRSFSCSSFKDIQSLCDDDDYDYLHQPDSPVASPRSSPTVFHRVRISTSASAHHLSFFALRHANSLPTTGKLLKIPDKPIIVYFTSLGVVRKTFEDCRAVRSILRGYRVPIDERDLSMDSQYVAELQGILGGSRNGKGFAIPCVFVGRSCVGGAEEVKRLHDNGELRAMIAGDLPPVAAAECGACGGMRYVACEQCHGSSKTYVDKSGFRSCKACNVNGLARCNVHGPMIEPLGLIGRRAHKKYSSRRPI